MRTYKYKIQNHQRNKYTCRECVANSLLGNQVIKKGNLKASLGFPFDC